MQRRRSISSRWRRSIIASRPAALALLAFFVSAVPCFAQAPAGDAAASVATDQEMLHDYLLATLGVEGAVRATMASGLEQWRELPTAWDTGRSGYAKRWASEFAETAVGDTTQYLVSRLLHHDPSFTRCGCSGFGRRLAHAISAPFIARTRAGVRVLSPAMVAGVLTGHLVSASTWYPAPGGARDGLKHAAVDLGGTIGVDVLREFWPHRKD
jgi:hypothetical protein